MWGSCRSRSRLRRGSSDKCGAVNADSDSRPLTSLGLPDIARRRCQGYVADVARTLKVIAAIESARKSDIAKAAELIDVRPANGQNLSLAARRTFNLLLKAAGSRIGDPIRHRILKKTLRRGHKSNDHLLDVLRELSGTNVDVRTPNSVGKDSIAFAQLVKTIIETSNESTSWVEFEFDADLRRVITNSEVYAVLKAQTVLALKSKYSLVMYEIGMKRLHMRTPSVTVTVEELRAALNVPKGTLLEFAQFNRRVLQAVKAELNQIAEFQFDYAVIRDGKTPVAVELSFWPKSGDAVDAAILEADRHSAGRRARRDGDVETIELDLPEPTLPLPVPLPSPPPPATKQRLRPARGLATISPLPGVDHEQLKAWVKNSKSVIEALSTIEAARKAEAEAPGAAARMMSAAFAAD